MRALFLADAHLCKPADHNYQVLQQFLTEQCGKTDLLILLGDIFEFWIGKETIVDEYVPLIKTLERMHQQGTKLIYVEGNHDFHLGPVFTDRLNCQVLPDGGSIELDGKKIYLAHGDLANPEDTGYRRLRNLLRSGLVRGLIRTLPSSLLMSLATRASFESRKSSAEKHQRWPAGEILRAYAEGILDSGHQAIVTGHYHQPLHEKVGDGELIALGDWISQFSYAVYEDGCFALRNYRPTSSASEAVS